MWTEVCDGNSDKRSTKHRCNQMTAKSAIVPERMQGHGALSRSPAVAWLSPKLRRNPSPSARMPISKDPGRRTLLPQCLSHRFSHSRGGGHHDNSRLKLAQARDKIFCAPEPPKFVPDIVADRSLKATVTGGHETLKACLKLDRICQNNLPPN